jgi:hypothetical protein
MPGGRGAMPPPEFRAWEAEIGRQKALTAVWATVPEP